MKERFEFDPEVSMRDYDGDDSWNDDPWEGAPWASELGSFDQFDQFDLEDREEKPRKAKAKTSKPKAKKKVKSAEVAEVAEVAEGVPELAVDPEVDGDELEKKPKRKPRKKGESNKELGARGEEAAARFLVRRGYEILERNWTCYAGEADIIARDEDNLVFCEVKTRKDCQKGFPAEAVGAEKREKYEKIALAFLRDYDVVDIAVRFDVISIVVMPPDRALIRHHIAAFNAS